MPEEWKVVRLVSFQIVNKKFINREQHVFKL